MKNILGTTLVVLSFVMLAGIGGGIDHMPNVFSAWLVTAVMTALTVLGGAIGLRLMSQP